MANSIRYSTPYDRPSRIRYLLPMLVMHLFLASASHHGDQAIERRVTGFKRDGTGVRTSDYWSGTNRYFPNIANYLEKRDPSLDLYREPLTREAVIDFFVQLAGSDEIVVPALENADVYGVDPTLAFTVAYIESSFRTDAVNVNTNPGRPRSVDRGLFQLNDLSFPHLSDDDFFHPDTNSRYAMEHLRYALNRADEDYRTAIAIYNAGERRVLAGNTPTSTQAYVRRATAYRESLINSFRAYIRRNFPPEPSDVAATN